jgi:WD40 repeat protein
LVWGQRYNPAFERTLIFLEYSKKEWETEQRIKELEAKRKLQRARVFALVLGTFTIIAIIFLVFALYQKSEAEKQEKIAKENATLATERQKQAEEQKRLADIAREEAVKAKDEAVEAQKAEAEQRKIAEANRVSAERNAAEAQRQTKIAKANEELANRKSEEARLNAERADKNAQEANKRRFIAIAKAMAIKSKSLNHDIDQQSVVAQQAFIFNDKYNDYKYDDDIYNGLYFALKSRKHPLTNSLEAHDNGAARALVTHVPTNTVYSAGSDGKIIRWNSSGDTWKKEILVDNPGIYQYYSLAISPDGKWLAAAGMNSVSETNNYVELYDLNDMKAAPKKITGYTYGIENLVFTPASDGFYARDNSGHSIKYSDLKTSKEVIKSTLKIHAIALSRDGNLIAGAAEVDQNTGSLMLWDTKQNFAVKEVKNISSTLTAVDFNPQGTQIVIGDNKGIVKLYDVRTGMTLRVLAGHKSVIEQITFNHAGTFMATASKDQTVRLWNIGNLKEQPIVFDDHSDWVWSATFSPNDEQLFASVHSSTETVAGKEHTIRAWPTKIEKMSDILCGLMSRNMTDDEWDIFVADDIDEELTCPSLPSNYKNDK